MTTATQSKAAKQRNEIARLTQRNGELAREVSRLRRALQNLLPFAEYQRARMLEPRNPKAITAAIDEARGALAQIKEALK